jgi:hypothetical protein
MNGKSIIAKEVRESVLSPVDRVSELLFGLFMALSFVGAVSVAETGEQIEAMFIAAVGCNLAWGLVDAVMFLVRTSPTAAGRSRWCAWCGARGTRKARVGSSSGR